MYRRGGMSQPFVQFFFFWHPDSLHKKEWYIQEKSFLRYAGFLLPEKRGILNWGSSRRGQIVRRVAAMRMHDQYVTHKKGDCPILLTFWPPDICNSNNLYHQQFWWVFFLCLTRANPEFKNKLSLQLLNEDQATHTNVAMQDKCTWQNANMWLNICTNSFAIQTIEHFYWFLLCF